METDQYKTLGSEGTGEFKDRGSKFLAYAYPAYSELEWQTHLEHVKKEHFKARHHCYAFRLGTDQNNFRANDDGEPSGTAGKPILGQIDRLGLTNVLVVVVRYFGGTKLGTSGLINAYRSSAAQALENAEVIHKTKQDLYRLSFDYALMSNIMNVVKKLGLEIVSQNFEAAATLDIAIRQSHVTQNITAIKAAAANVSLEEAAGMDQVDRLKMSFLGNR